MSRQSNTRWDLCIWAFNHGHSVEEAISLVDCVEDKKIQIEYAMTELEKRAAQKAFNEMVESVKSIYERIVGT